MFSLRWNVYVVPSLEISQLFASPGCTLLSESRDSSPSYTLPISTCSIADPDWWRMSRLTGASFSPMVTVLEAPFSAVSLDALLLRNTTTPTMMATTAITAMMAMIHLLGPLDFGDLARAFKVASVLAEVAG